MTKTQILIEANKLINQKNSYTLNGILNNNKIVLSYELVVNYIDVINFLPESALELHNQSSICVFKSGPNDTKQSSILDLRTDDFNLEISFSLSKDSIINCPKKESEERGNRSNNSTLTSLYSWNSYWDQNKTLFLNTCGYLRIYIYSQVVFVDLVEYGSIETYKLCINNSPGRTNILQQNSIGQTEDGINYKYYLVVNRISDMLTLVLYKKFRYGTENNWNEQEEIGRKSIRLANSVLGVCPFVYNNKSWHTTRIGHMALNDGSRTEYFFGWLHYFNLSIEEPLKVYDEPEILNLSFNVKETDFNTSCLKLNFTVEGEYKQESLLKLKFKIDIPDIDYENNNLLQLLFHIDSTEIEENILNLGFLLGSQEYKSKKFMLRFIIQEKEEILGFKEVNFYNERNVVKYIAPYNNRSCKKNTERDIKNVRVYYEFDTEREILRSEIEEIKDIGTLDDEDIVFEIANQNVFFIELDNNIANLYRKDTLTSQSILIASLKTVNNEDLIFKNKWSHIALTYDSETSTLILYIDGQQVYTTTDIKNLECGYIQLNTFNTEKSSTYFAGVCITDNIEYESNFTIKSGPVSLPISMPAIKIPISRVIKIEPKTSSPNIIITKYRVPHLRQILFIYTDNIPWIILEKRIFFMSTKILVWGYYIQSYYNIPNLNISWSGSRIFGPLTSNPYLIGGTISLYPRHTAYPEYTRYNSIIRYAESWTLDFWYFRRVEGSSSHIDILNIKNKYQTFKFSTQYFTSIFKENITNYPSNRYIQPNKWMYILLSYNIKTSILSIYIDKIQVYQIYIRLASPSEILFSVGNNLKNCNFFADIRLLDEAQSDSNLNKIEPLNPEILSVASPMKRIIATNPAKEVIFVYDGIDTHAIDYRLFMKNIFPISNTANLQDSYKFNVNYICSNPYYSKNITIGNNYEYKWYNVAYIGPDNTDSIGYMNYKATSLRKLNNYTIDFWVYKENNYVAENSLEYPLFDLIGSGNKIRIIMENTKIRYYSYINNTWVQELLINNKSNTFIKNWSHIAVTFNNDSKQISVFINGEKYAESITFSSLSLEELNIYTNTKSISTHYLTSIRISDIIRFNNKYNLEDVSHPYGQLLSNNTSATIEVTKVPEVIIEEEIKEEVPTEFEVKYFDTSREFVIQDDFTFKTERNAIIPTEFEVKYFDTSREFVIQDDFTFKTERNAIAPTEFEVKYFDTSREFVIQDDFTFKTERNAIIPTEFEVKYFDTSREFVIQDDFTFKTERNAIIPTEFEVKYFDTSREFVIPNTFIFDTERKYKKKTIFEAKYFNTELDIVK